MMEMLIIFLLVMISWLNKILKLIKLSTFLVLDKGVTNMKREKITMSFVMLDWNQNYQCERLVFNIQRKRNLFNI